MVKQLQDRNFAKGLGKVVIIETCFIDDLDSNLRSGNKSVQICARTTCGVWKNNMITY